MFLKSVDTSTENTDLLEIFDHFVREVGPENIVQFITDIDARYKAAVLDIDTSSGCDTSYGQDTSSATQHTNYKNTFIHAQLLITSAIYIHIGRATP
jgi:hypothetical protein